MTSFKTLPPDARARIEAATAWRQRLKQNPVLELSAEYLEWISKPDNCQAYNAVGEALAALGEVAFAPEILDIRKIALHHARRGLVRQRGLCGGAIAKIAVALLLFGVVGGAALYFYRNTPDYYATGAGERRVFALADGSRISLDSNTEVQARYTETARTIVLDRGRARFDVAHDAKRPFSVAAGGETVVAVGTSFSVERLGPKVVVTLLQGHVVIKGTAGSGQNRSGRLQAISLSAGQELTTSADSKPEIEATNVQIATAWESGKLVFRDESLAEAVERVNRYTDKPISVDPNIASIRINGVFNAGDVGAFVSGVTSYFPIQATTDSDSNIILQHR
jgi:transmembrane sensor